MNLALSFTVPSDEGDTTNCAVSRPGEQTSTSAAKVNDLPIAVLQDDLAASSGEAVLTAFRGLDNVQSFGIPSAGYSSANAIHSLYDGALIVLTGSVYVDRDGVNLDERAIEPAIEVAGSLAGQAAVEWLNRQGCS